MTLLLAFDSTHLAIASEKKAKAEGLSARLVPTPESISASCGLSLRVCDGEVAWAKDFLSDKEKEDAQLFEISTEDHKKSYQKISW